MAHEKYKARIKSLILLLKYVKQYTATYITHVLKSSCDFHMQGRQHEKDNSLLFVVFLSPLVIHYITRVKMVNDVKRSVNQKERRVKHQ